MRIKIMRMLIAVFLFSLCTGLTYIYVHRRSVNKEINRTYHAGLEPFRIATNPFYPAAQVAHFDSILVIQHGPNARMVQCMKAYSLLSLGDEKQAVDILEMLNRPPAPEHDRLTDQIHALLGLAYLRLGERNNCISAHCAGSCVFPIRNDGVYSDPYASRKAIDTYQQFLRDRPGDLTTRWLLNIAYMTLGLYPAKVPSQWLIPGLDTDTLSGPVKPFTGMAGGLGLNGSRNMAGGAIVDDFD